MSFKSRSEAGKRLAAQLTGLTDEVVVLGLPRGGVPVAFEVATALRAPLDVIVVRKLGVPFQPELGMGAIGEDGARVINDEVLTLAGVTREQLAAVEERERAELDRRARRFRGGRPRLDLTGRTALIVDDGIATGSTARAACQVAREHGAQRVVLATPVAPPDVWERFADDVDELIVLETPSNFHGVGQFYADFSQTSDKEVVELLQLSPAPDATDPPSATRGTAAVHREDLAIPMGPVTLAGSLVIPERSLGLVIFAHGSGSSRHSSRNRYVASLLNAAGIGTLLFDLLSAREEVNRMNVFDIELLAERLVGVTDWLREMPEAAGLPFGYFGASTGAAAALWAAAEPGAQLAAVVSRGGRPDLAMGRLAGVSAPTLLIVGGADHAVLDLNRQAERQLRCEHDLEVVEGATHLFEEPGTLARAAELARHWFDGHFRNAADVSG